MKNQSKRSANDKAQYLISLEGDSGFEKKSKKTKAATTLSKATLER